LGKLFLAVNNIKILDEDERKCLVEKIKQDYIS